MAQKKRKRKYRSKDQTQKSFGIHKELERQRYYIELWPEAFVYHIRGSLGGLFDLVTIDDKEPLDVGGNLYIARDRIQVHLIDIKAGSAAYIKTERRKFKEHCDRLPILTGLHYLFDSTVRGSGVWKSESYPGDFENDKT